MVKNLIAIVVTLSLLLGISLYEISFMKKEFSLFTEEVQALADKTEEETATIEDAKAVKAGWDSLKEKMHVWVPHNDLSGIDNQLSEAVGYLYNDRYELALPKILVVLELCEKIPSSYSLSLENIL